jgi:hypothetical protein
MAFALQSAGGVDRFRSIKARGAFGHCFVPFPRFEKPEILDMNDFCDGKTVVDFRKLHVFRLEAGQARRLPELHIRVASK